MLTKAFFTAADVDESERLVRRGRPKLPDAKRRVTLRLDPDLIDGLRSTCPRGRTRVNEALKPWLALSKAV